MTNRPTIHFGGQTKRENIELFGFDTAKTWDYENGYFLTSDVSRIGKILAHWEFYSAISDLPGHVVECGVFKGASLIRFATFRELLESPSSRKIIGFDVFGDFPDASNAADAHFVEQWQRAAGAGIPKEELERVFWHKKIRNVELVKGDINHTAPDYCAANHHLKIAILHIDTDILEPARVALEQFYSRVVKGGIIILDDYGTEYGGTKAVDDYFAEKDVQIKKLSISHASPSYIIKP